MSFIDSIKYSINRRLNKLSKRWAYIKYGDRTYYHFNDELINIGNKYTYGIPELCRYDYKTKLHIGKYCSIAKGVKIMLGGNHHSDWISTFPFFREVDIFPECGGWSERFKGDVIIGNDVWLGRDVLVLSGVKIGDGACIGAGAIVSKDIPPYSIAVGNPIKIIKYRFNESQIKALLEIQWWNWSEEKINKKLKLICSTNVDEFIESVLGPNWKEEL